MARLGHAETGSEDAAELAAFFPVQTKGLLRRTRVIVPQAVKTPAQRTRRAALIEALSYGGFARALALSPHDVAAAWPWGSDRAADHLLAAMAARSAPDAIVATVTEALTTTDPIDPYALTPLLPRLTRAQRRQVTLRLLRAKGASFVLASALAGGDGGIDDAIRTAAGADLLEALRARDAKPGEQAAELLALGLLASRAAAKQALDALAGAGLIASDPRLDMLRLNAALEDRGVTP